MIGAEWVPIRYDCGHYELRKAMLRKQREKSCGMLFGGRHCTSCKPRCDDEQHKRYSNHKNARLAADLQNMLDDYKAKGKKPPRRRPVSTSLIREGR